jgi:hypothetical protein
MTIDKTPSKEKKSKQDAFLKTRCISNNPTGVRLVGKDTHTNAQRMAGYLGFPTVTSFEGILELDGQSTNPPLAVLVSQAS